MLTRWINNICSKRTVGLAIHVTLFALIMVAGRCVPLGPTFGGTLPIPLLT